MRVVMMCGLPGSGKTAKAKTYGGWNVVTVNMDDHMKSVDETFGELPAYMFRPVVDTYVIDGLMLSDKVRADMLNAWYGTVTKYGNPEEIRIEIHEWNVDRDACLSNDRFRRDKDSGTTILTARFESVDTERLMKSLNFRADVSVIKETVRRYSLEEMIRNDCGDTLTSERWSLGGTWGNCWGDSGIVGGEDPVEFTGFDEVIMKYFPDIRMREYKEIYDACVHTVTECEGDYYGGTVQYERYVCNTSFLIEKLKEMGLITG